MIDSLKSLSNDLWAITTYFNPSGYRTWPLNYRIFRDRLEVPLLTVEVAYGEFFELGNNDAEHLIQLRSDQVMFQKERLLNLALAALPAECQKVVWVDCDTLFEQADWARRTSLALDEYALVQPFARVSELDPQVDVSRPLVSQSYLTRDSIASRFVADTLGMPGLERPQTWLADNGKFLDYTPGHAWAMRRELLEQVGFYDTMIMGSGSMAMAQAAVKTPEDFAKRYGLTVPHTAHYLKWAERFESLVQGSVGIVPGDVYHLYHGDLKNRRYRQRLSVLRDSDFDPQLDITVADNGCWRWNSDKPGLHRGVIDYFQSRREDE